MNVDAPMKHYAGGKGRKAPPKPAPQPKKPGKKGY